MVKRVGVGEGRMVGSGFRVGVGMVVVWEVACGLEVGRKTAVGIRVGKVCPPKQPLKKKATPKKNNL